MLTTAGDATRAALAKLLTPLLPPAAKGPDDSITGTAGGNTALRLSHSGFSVATTKKAASNTVTDWANTSQSRFMGAGSLTGGGIPQGDFAYCPAYANMMSGVGRFDANQSACAALRVQWYVGQIQEWSKK
jgi:hypothetical protein